MSEKLCIIAYVPVLHKGYKALLEKYKTADTLYILGEEVLNEFDYLRKDLRQLNAEDAVTAVQGWGLIQDVRILTKKDLRELSKSNTKIVMPDEDIARELNEKYFDNRAELYPIFLRWDRRNTKESNLLDPDRTISTEDFDREMIDLAGKVGKHSADYYRRIGSVITKDKQIILMAYNKHLPSAHTPWIEGDARNTLNKGVGIEVTTVMHSEAALIAKAAKQGISLKGTSLYVTDFPCPLCAKYIALSGINKCYYGNGYAVLDGQRVLQDFNVELIHVTGVQTDQSHEAVWQKYPEKK